MEGIEYTLKGKSESYNEKSPFILESKIPGQPTSPIQSPIFLLYKIVLLIRAE